MTRQNVGAIAEGAAENIGHEEDLGDFNGVADVNHLTPLPDQDLTNR